MTEVSQFPGTIRYCCCLVVVDYCCLVVVDYCVCMSLGYGLEYHTQT